MAISAHGMSGAKVGVWRFWHRWRARGGGGGEGYRVRIKLLEKCSRLASYRSQRNESHGWDRDWGRRGEGEGQKESSLRKGGVDRASV